MATALGDCGNGGCEAVGQGMDARDLAVKGECEVSGDGSYVLVNGGEADPAEGNVIAGKGGEGVVVVENAGLDGAEGMAVGNGEEGNGQLESVVDSESYESGPVECASSLELGNGHNHKEGGDASSCFHSVDGSSTEGRTGQDENGQSSNGRNGNVTDEDIAAIDVSSELHDPADEQSVSEITAGEISAPEMPINGQSVPELAIESNGHDHGEQCIISDFEIVDEVKVQPGSNSNVEETPESLEKANENGLKTEEDNVNLVADAVIADEKDVDLTAEPPAAVQGSRELEIHVDKGEGMAEEVLVAGVVPPVEESPEVISDASRNEGSGTTEVKHQEEIATDIPEPREVGKKQESDVFVIEVIASENWASENGKEISDTFTEIPEDNKSCDLELDQEQLSHKESETHIENEDSEHCETDSPCTVNIVELKNADHLGGHNLDLVPIDDNELAAHTEKEASISIENITAQNEEGSASGERCTDTDHATVNENEAEEVMKSSLEIQYANGNEIVSSPGADKENSDDKIEQVDMKDDAPVSSSWAEVVELESLAKEKSEEERQETCLADVAAVSNDSNDEYSTKDSLTEDEKANFHTANNLKGTGMKNDVTEESRDIEVSSDANDISIEGQIAHSIQGRPIADIDIKNQPCYMIRVPFFHDDGLMAKKRMLEMQVEEKTSNRDSINATIQAKKVSRDQCWREFDSARLSERAARDAFNAKRQEREAIQLLVNRMSNVNSIDNIDDKIRDLEHRIQHETISLKEEKQLIREIKLFKQNRERLYSTVGTEDEVQEAFHQKDSIEKKFEMLNKELDTCRQATLEAERKSKAARRKHDEQLQIFTELRIQYSAADKLRQEAFMQLKTVKKALHERNLQYYQYRDNRRAAENYASLGDRESLRCLCTEQVEKFMDLWKKNDEFRKQYVNSNMISTVRRFRTLDGRSLGLNEQPIILPSLVRDKSRTGPSPAANVDSVVPSETNQEKKDIIPLGSADLQPSSEMPQKDKIVKPKKPSKSYKISSRDAVVMEVSSEVTSEVVENEKEKVEEDELTRKANELARQKEEEMAQKEEEIRKEMAAAELKEKHRMEQIAKAKEAEDRKQRRAEKAKAKAEIKAKKEAEERGKKKAKKEGQKGKMLAVATDAASEGTEAESLPASGASPPETVEDSQVKAPTVSKRPSRTQAASKHQNKITPIPPPLRNRGKKKMQAWMWVLLCALIVVVLFIAGNHISPSKINLANFGF